jgi:hypothetical protein
LLQDIQKLLKRARRCAPVATDVTAQSVGWVNEKNVLRGVCNLAEVPLIISSNVGTGCHQESRKWQDI